MKKPTLLIFFLSFAIFANAQTPDTASVHSEIDQIILEATKKLNDNNFSADVLESLERAEKICKEGFGENHPLFAKILFNKGRFYGKSGKIQPAKKIFVLAEKIQRETLGKQHKDYAATRLNLGQVSLDMGQYGKAETHFSTALRYYEEKFGRDNEYVIIAIIGLANTYFRTDRYGQAEKIFLEAHELLVTKNEKYHFDNTRVLSGLGNLYYKMGNYEKAIATLLETESNLLSAPKVDSASYIGNVENLGNIYKELKDYEKAEKSYLYSLKVKASIFGKDHFRYGLGVGNTADLYLKMGKFKESEKYALESLQIYKNVFGTTHPQYAQALMDVAKLYYQIGEGELSKPLFEEALKIRTDVYGELHPKYAWVHHHAGKLYSRLKEYPEASKRFEEMSDVFKNILLIRSRHLSENELGNYLRHFSKNNIVSNSFAQVYPPFAGVCYDNTLFHKGFIQNGLKRVNLLSQKNPEAAEKYEQLRVLHQELAQQYSRPEKRRTGVTDLEKDINTLEKEIVEQVRGFGDAVSQVTWKEVQQSLKNQEAALEFIRYPFQNPEPTDSIMYAALLVRPHDERPEFVALFEEKQLSDLLNSSYENSPIAGVGQVNYRGLTPKNKFSKSGLYDLVWKPLESVLKETKTIYFSPTGLLHQLNFNSISIENNEILADRFRLIQLGSTRSLAAKEAENEYLENSAMLFGGIDYSPGNTESELEIFAFSSDEEMLVARGDSDKKEDWKFLLGSETEVKKIARQLENEHITYSLLTGSEATEGVFKSFGTEQNSPRILHLATHGFFFPDQVSFKKKSGYSVFETSKNPMMRSGLVLAGGNQMWKGEDNIEDMTGIEDGILTAFEISRMNLSNTELVVLSACETGLGDIKGNEGVYGLQRAFKIAGVKYLLMSLWQVPDKQTQELMSVFYENYLKKKMSIPEAFRAAQQKMREKYDDPYSWAGFVLVE